MVKIAKSRLKTSSHIEKYEVQMDRALKAFSDKPKTMLQVSVETGILRANLCRFMSKWRERGLITMVGEGVCSISKHKAGFYQSTSQL